MAKKTVKAILPESESCADAVETDDMTAEERDALIALTDIEGGAEARWQIHRVAPTTDPKRKPLGFIAELSSSELSLAELQARFGGGKYRIKGMRSDGTYLKHATVTIGADAIAAPSPAPTAPGSNDVLTLLERMESREEQRAERRRELMALTIPAAITAATAIITKMLERKESNSTTEAVTLLAGLKQLVPEAKPGPDMTEVTFKLLEFAKDAMGGGKDEGWLGFAKDAMKELPALMGGVKMPLAISASATPSPSLSSPSQPQSQANPMLQLITWARGALAHLCKMAARNADPAAHAVAMLDTIPDGVDASQFVKYLDAPNWWHVLQQFYPGVGPYQHWFDEFRKELKDEWQYRTNPPGEVEGDVAAPVVLFDDSEPEA